MSIYKQGDTIVFDFTTHNPSTGAVQDADSTPTVEVFEDAVDTPQAGVSIAKRSGKTGNYRVSIVATVGNGYEIGKNYNVVVSATVNSISAKSCISSFMLDGKRVNDLNDIATSSIFSSTVEGSLTFLHAIRIGLATLAGKSSGGGTTTVAFRDQADSKNRVTATVDANGNRTSITVDGT